MLERKEGVAATMHIVFVGKNMCCIGLSIPLRCIWFKKGVMTEAGNCGLIEKVARSSILDVISVVAGSVTAKAYSNAVLPVVDLTDPNFVSFQPVTSYQEYWDQKCTYLANVVYLDWKVRKT